MPLQTKSKFGTAYQQILIEFLSIDIAKGDFLTSKDFS